MYYKIQTNGYPNLENFDKGFGFYLVRNVLDNLEDVIFYNSNNRSFLYLSPISEIPSEFLSLFEDKEEEDEKTSHKEGYVSEMFALKAMALAKANTQSIKVSDIIRDD